MSRNQHSVVSAFCAMASGLAAVEVELFGGSGGWKPINPRQHRFLSDIFEVVRWEDSHVTDVVKTGVGRSADEINVFLAGCGMNDLHMEPFPPGSVAFAALMKIGACWINEGISTQIRGVNGMRYPGVRISLQYEDIAGDNLVFRTSPRHAEPIVTLLTNRPMDVIHLTKFKEDLEGLDLVARAAELLLETRFIRDFEGVHFPMVDLTVRPDVRWLLGMSHESDQGESATLAQVFQQCRVQMNHLGATAEDLVVGSVTMTSLSIPKPNLLINDDFLMVFERRGIPQPLFTAILRPDAWKDPGELVFS